MNVRGVVTGQEYHRGGDLGRRAHPPRRDAREHRRDVVGELLLAFGGDRSRRDGVDPHSERPVLRGPRPSERVDGRLVRLVDRRTVAATQPGDRPDVHDGALTALGHPRREQPGEKKRRKDVDRERITQQLLGDVSGRRRHQQHCRVVDQDVDAAFRRRGGLLNKAADLSFPGADVGGNELGAASCGPDAGDDGIAALLIATTDDDECSLVGQRRRDGHPEAACRTGDKCCAAS